MIAGWLHAREETFVAPPPPADRVLDDARTFARSPERYRAVAAVLEELERRHGFRFYYVLYGSLYGRNLGDRAREFQEAWLGDSPGLVLLLETDSKNFRIKQTTAEPIEVVPGTTLPLTGPKELVSSDLAELVRGLENDLRGVEASDDFAERLATGMASGVATLLDKREAAPDGDTRGQAALLAAGFGAAAGLAALLVVAVLKRSDAKSRERYVFPRARVGIRLGAPYGGGKISSRSFGNQEES